MFNFNQWKQKPEVLVVRIANQRLAIAADDLSRRVGDLQGMLLQASSQAAGAETKHDLCDSAGKGVPLYKLGSAEAAAANALDDETRRQFLAAVLQKAEETAKQCTAVLHQTIKASTYVYQPLKAIDASLWQLRGLLKSCDPSKSTCSANQLQGLADLAGAIRLTVVQLRDKAIAENKIELWSWPVFVWPLLALICAGVGFFLFGNAYNFSLFYGGPDASLYEMIAGLGGISMAVLVPFWCAVKVNQHVERCVSPPSEGERKPDTDKPTPTGK